MKLHRFEWSSCTNRIRMDVFLLISFIFPLRFALGENGVNEDGTISSLLRMNTNVDNPGIYLRLMPTGLAYLREIGMKVVNDEVLNLQLPTITETVELGQVTIFNARITKYWAPNDYSLDLTPPDTFTWSMSKMHIRAYGEFEARVNSALLLPSLPIRGEFEALLGHLGSTISVRLGRTAAGAPSVQSAYCSASIGYVDMNVRNTGVITDLFINSLKAFLIAHFKPMVEQRMCQMIRNVIDRDMNGILATMPLKVRLNENSLDIIGETFGIAEPKHHGHGNGHGQGQGKGITSTSRNFTLLNFVNHLREKNLVLDYALIRDPFISGGSIAIWSKGEISYRGNGGTPFYPPTISIPPPQGVHMIEFFGTDYIANSMLYHAYKQKYMDVTVGPESSAQLRDVLITTCESFCLGEFLGGLGQQFPNRQVEVRFSAIKSPVMVFVADKARFRLHGNMNMYVRPNNATQIKLMVIKSTVTMTSNIRLWINGTRIVGNATIDNLDFRLQETRITDVDQAVFGDLGLFGAEFLEKLLTEILQLGLIIPQMKGVILRSPKLIIHERYLRVQAYFKLDEQYAGRLIESAVKRTLVNVGR